MVLAAGVVFLPHLCLALLDYTVVWGRCSTVRNEKAEEKSIYPWL